MLQLFELGTLGFYILTGLSFVTIIALVENNLPGWSTVTLVGTFALLAILGNVNIVRLVISNPQLALVLLAAYFVAGVVWSLVKWWLFVLKRRDEYKDMLVAFLRDNNLVGNKLPKELAVKFYEQYRYYEPIGGGKLQDPPSASRNKGRIMGWLAYWPFSLAWTVIDDPVKRTWKFIYTRTSALYEAIAKNMYKDIREQP